jgi:hypothetical protein
MTGFFTPAATRAFILIWVAVAVLWGVLAIALGGREASVSVVFSTFCKDHPIVVLALGILLGHWLWSL